MDADFPAAHSMDAAWYAVDKCGHVARFDTGEAGAVPEFAGDPEEDPYEELRDAVPAVEPVYEREGRIEPGREASGSHHYFEGRGDPGGTLMFVRSIDAVAPEIKRGEAVQVKAKGFAVVFKNLTKAVAKRIHEAKACLGCFYHFDSEDEGGADPARLGLFSYSHLCENWIAGPYGRHSSPSRPLQVGQLPPAVREFVNRVRFDTLCFAEAVRLQPASLGPVVAWDCAWLDLDGKTVRCVPGMEEEYRKYYEQMKANPDPGLALEPPPE